MKTLVSMAVAGAVGLTGVAASATGASANGWSQGPYPGPYWGHPRPHYVYRTGPDGGAIVAGTLFGLFAGAIAADALNQPPPPPYPAYASAYDEHVDWCRKTYNSYDARTDTWVDFEGVAHQCIERVQ
ncbi:MAG TPA: BA14K family protein [Bauldia sp.]|nr:BA14K family protein [Bauldia sp.]